jgi:lipopolysaccharide biosynthesis glycosyltransferase
MALGSLAIHSVHAKRIVVINIQKWSGISPLISPESIEIISRICDVLKLELEVIEIQVPTSFTSWNLHEYGHISIAAWAKVIVLFQLRAKNDEELLYIDPDTLLLENFEEIFQLKTKAATSLMARQSNGHELFENYWINQRFKFPPRDLLETNWYFNSGIMKLNLNTWQSHEFWIKWDELIRHPQKYRLEIVDQDLLNALVLGDYGRIPISFNCYPSEYRPNVTKIIHFAGGLKPWYFRNALSRLRLNKPTRAAMELWRKNERRTLVLIRNETDQNLYDRLHIMRKKSDKNYRFIIIQLFPRVSRSKLALKLNCLRKRILNEI